MARGIMCGALGILAGAARGSYEVTNTVYASCRNSAGVTQPLVLSATTFTVTDAPLITAPPAVTPFRLIVEIYDETGRLVRTLQEVRVAVMANISRVGDGSGRVEPAPGQLVLITMSDGTIVSWDGRDSGGRPAPNGIYTARATSGPPTTVGLVQYSTATFMLIRPYGKLIVGATLVPNPADEVAWISFRLASSFATVDIKIYDVTGVLIHVGTASGTARSYRWPLQNQAGTRVADGIYVIVLEGYDPMTDDRQRVIKKLAVRHERN